MQLRGRKIRASDIAFGDGQEGVSEKVERVAEACTRELYGGAPTDGDPAR